jgi:hypothetical protein
LCEQTLPATCHYSPYWNSACPLALTWGPPYAHHPPPTCPLPPTRPGLQESSKKQASLERWEAELRTLDAQLKERSREAEATRLKLVEERGVMEGVRREAAAADARGAEQVRRSWAPTASTAGTCLHQQPHFMLAPACGRCVVAAG